MRQQRSNLALRQRQLAALTVRAGLAGVVQEVAVQEGQQVAAGANLARVARTDALMARLQVPEVQAKDVALSMPVRVDTHNGLIDGTVTGKYEENGQHLVEITQKATTYNDETSATGVAVVQLPSRGA